MQYAASKTKHTNGGCHISICYIHSSWMMWMVRRSPWLLRCWRQYWQKFHHSVLDLMSTLSAISNMERTVLCGSSLSRRQHCSLVRCLFSVIVVLKVNFRCNFSSWLFSLFVLLVLVDYMALFWTEKILSASCNCKIYKSKSHGVCVACIFVFKALH